MNHDQQADPSTPAAEDGAAPCNTLAPSMPIPRRWRNHPLIQGRHFYVLPPAVLAGLESILDPAYCDSDLWQMERELADLADHLPSGTVGCWNGQHAIRCLSLVPPPRKPLSDTQRAMKHLERKLGLNPSAKRRRSATSAEGLSIQQMAKAYAGWLVADPLFMREHDQLLQGLSDPDGLARTHNLLDAPLPMFPIRPDGPGAGPWLAFCSRWRLQGLAGPYLPVPFPASGQTLSQAMSVRASCAAGLFIHIPDIYPASVWPQLVDVDRNERQTAGGNEHLRDWLAIITSQNKAKQVERLGRQWIVHHIWRVLQQRHGPAIRRKKKRISPYLADHVHVEPLAAQSYLSTFVSRIATSS